MATAEFSKFVDILSAALSQHHLLGFEIVQLLSKSLIQFDGWDCVPSLLFSMANKWETMETVTDFILGGSQITADDDCSHEIKRDLLLGGKPMTNLDSNRDIILPTNVHQVKTMVFPVVMYGFES